MKAPLIFLELNNSDFPYGTDEPLNIFESQIQIYCPIQVYDQNPIFYRR